MTKDKDNEIRTTDNHSLLYKGKRLFKLRRYRGHNAVYEEVDPKAYDKRIHELASKIALCPEVDLISIVRDALYDLPLIGLDRVEEKVNRELEAASRSGREPRVRTQAPLRGTCVDLWIGARPLLGLRE